MKDIREFADLLDAPHHVSRTRPQMPDRERAAQFSPFAALTDYNAAVKETARRTEERAELSESEAEELNRRIRYLMEEISGGDPKALPEAGITYFVPDGKKTGGTYLTVTGPVLKIDEAGRTVTMKDGPVIPVCDIVRIEEADGPFSEE